ncbi:MAG TPA: cell division protein FtsZ [Candidatus Limnocylindria bacterium]|nr:cell division protein FtsZ [Candidatus Limnocylindria bacterium]
MEVFLNNFPLLVIAGVALLLLILLARSVLAGRRQVEARTIRVVGVGGAGGNAVDGMIRAGTRGVEFVACNTDAQALRRSLARHRIRIGQAITGGLGTGGDPDVGRRAAEEDSHKVADAIRGSDMVFITAGLGGGTGSGAAPVIAAIAREQGALTLGVVTKPFAFEGARRRVVAEEAADELRQRVDALIVIPNDRVRGVVEQGTSILDAFQVVDDVLRQSIQGILDVITMPGLVNLDFADVSAILKGGGNTVMGVGRAGGEQRALVAARQAMSGPLLEGSINGARAILFNVAGSSGLSLFEVSEAAEAIRAAADPEASVIFGASFDEDLADEVRVTVVATGFEQARAVEPEAGDRLPEIVAAGPATAANPGVVGQPMEPAAPVSGRLLAEEDRRAGRPRARRPPAPGRGPGEPREAGAASETSPAQSLEATPDEVAVAGPGDLEVPSFIRRQRRPPTNGLEAGSSEAGSSEAGSSEAGSSEAGSSEADRDR